MKKIISILLAVIMLALAVPFTASAADSAPADLPYITSNSVGFIDYAGSDDASGSSASTAKKGFGSARANGVVGLLSKGGTMVVSGKAYMGATYTLPALSSPLLITSNYGGTNYMNAEPANNPSCAFKLKDGATFTIQSDVIIDDVIMFQEGANQNKIVVTNGATLVIGDGVVNMTKRAFQIKIVVESGARLIVGGGDFEIENNGGEVIEGYTYEYNKTTATTVTPEKEVDYSDIPAGIAFVAYNEGKNSNDGLSASAPKKSLLGANEEGGTMYMVRGGGTIVVTGRLYIGTDYTIPKLGGQLTVTGVHDGTSYINAEPETNPAGGMMKFATNKVLTIEGDVKLENIILFQESGQNTIKVANGGKLTIGENVIFMTKQLYNMKLEVANGGVVVFESTEHGFDTISGDGIVVMPETSMGSFVKSRTYDGRFTDVTADKWFNEYVKTAYEYTLANGTSDTKFSPDNKFTVAQALTAAANIHAAYYGKTVAAAKDGESWFTPYVNYCLDNGIIVVGQFADYNKNITRGDMAIVFASILPESEYAATRTGSCADVTASDACYNAVTKLYNAGIVSGDAGKGTYRPNEEIVRSEACVIFTRIAAKEYRAK